MVTVRDEDPTTNTPLRLKNSAETRTRGTPEAPAKGWADTAGNEAKVSRNAAANMLVTIDRGLQRLYFQKLLRHVQTQKAQKAAKEAAAQKAAVEAVAQKAAKEAQAIKRAKVSRDAAARMLVTIERGL